MKKQKKNKDVDRVLDYLGEIIETPLYPTDMKDAVIGCVERFGMGPVVLLDREKCVKILMRNGIKKREDAEEFYEFNTLGAWVGEGTPAFATLNKDILKRL